MKVETKDLPKSQLELTVELTYEEFKPFIERGAEAISREVKVEGFRQGKVPYEILKNKVGEMAILEESARIAINKTIAEAISKSAEKKDAIGQPQVNITKLAPENSLEYKVIINIIPEITLPDLKSAKVKIKAVEVSEEDVNKLIENLREMRVKEVIAEKEAADGDKVLADVEMFLDNVPIEGGVGKGAAVILGKNYIVPGFDKNLFGMKKGETREFKVHYPEDHYMKNIAGKMVEFRVKINEVYSRELPVFDDEFAKNFGVNNAEELKNNIKKSLEEEKKNKEAQRVEIEIIEKLLEGAKFGDIPEMLIDNEADSMVHELEHDIEHQGMKFEDYLTSIKKTHDQLLLDFVPQAIKRLKSALMIREIAKQEKVEVSEKEVDEKVESLVKQYKGYEKVEKRVKSPEYRHQLRNQIANNKVINLLREWNIEK